MEQSSWPPRWLTSVPEKAIERGRKLEPVAEFAEAFGVITKDSVAGKSGAPLVLRDWQRSLLEHMFAFENGGYRHQSQLVLMPRKNGKSALGSVIGLYGLIVGPSGAEVYSVAAEKEQARIVFADARRMIEASEELSSITKLYRDAIEMPKLNSVYRVMSAEAYSKEGLSPTMTVFDELHAQKNRDLYDTFSLAMGARGKLATLIAISTAGVRMDSTGRDSICYSLYQYGQKVARGEIDDPTFFMAAWEAPEDSDHKSPETWALANPGFNDINTQSDFESAVRRTPEAEFRTKRCNQWVSSQQAWLPQGVWDELGGDITISPDEEYILGFDGSYANDSTAICAVTVPKPGEKAKVQLIEVWEKNFERDDDSWRVSIDAVKQKIIDYTQEYPLVREIACDPYRWASMMQDLDELGLPIVEYKTNMLNLMIPATQKVFEAITEGRLVHDGNPILSRHMDNCVIKIDHRGQRVTKESSTSRKKIDAAIAFIIAYDRADASRIDEGVPQFFL